MWDWEWYGGGCDGRGGRMYVVGRFVGVRGRGRDCGCDYGRGYGHYYGCAYVEWTGGLYSSSRRIDLGVELSDEAQAELGLEYVVDTLVGEGRNVVVCRCQY